MFIKLTDPAGGLIIRVNSRHIVAYTGIQNGTNVQIGDRLLHVKEQPDTIDRLLKGEKE
jgi:hypothetical protein